MVARQAPSLTRTPPVDAAMRRTLRCALDSFFMCSPWLISRWLTPPRLLRVSPRVDQSQLRPWPAFGHYVVAGSTPGNRHRKVAGVAHLIPHYWVEAHSAGWSAGPHHRGRLCRGIMHVARQVLESCNTAKARARVAAGSPVWTPCAPIVDVECNSVDGKSTMGSTRALPGMSSACAAALAYIHGRGAVERCAVEWSAAP